MVKAGACWPKWYKRYMAESDSEVVTNGHWGCKEDFLCTTIGETTGLGEMVFKFKRHDIVSELGEFRAPG